MADREKILRYFKAGGDEQLAAKLLEGEEAMKAAAAQAYLSRDDLLDMLTRMSQLCREKGETDQAENYAGLARAVYSLFEGREDAQGYNQWERKWLNEEVWPRLEH